MAQLLFIPNPQTLIWLPAPEGKPESWVEAVRRGEWALPEKVRRVYDLPSNQRLQVSVHGDLVIVFPVRPLKGNFSHIQVELTEEEQSVLALLADGLTAGQVAAKLHAKRRRVLYLIEKMRRVYGASSTADLIRLQYFSQR